MRQKLLLLKLAFKLAGMFLVDFYKESKREIEDKRLYPQENYDTCLLRSADILFNASKRAIAFYALAIAAHREECHGEGKLDEKVDLKKDLSDREYNQASTRGFWMA